MKKLLIAVFAAIMILAIGAISVFAAPKGTGQNFVDPNNDGICDRSSFADSNGDGTCDNSIRGGECHRNGSENRYGRGHCKTI